MLEINYVRDQYQKIFEYNNSSIFKVDKLRFLVGVSISNSQKLIEWIYREVGGYSRPEKHYEPILHN